MIERTVFDDGYTSKPFIVANDAGLRALPRWLKERGCNTYSYAKQTVIGVGYDSKPDSDWGKYERRGTIFIRNAAMFDAVCEVIRKTYGWPEEPKP